MVRHHAAGYDLPRRPPAQRDGAPKAVGRYSRTRSRCLGPLAGDDAVGNNLLFRVTPRFGDPDLTEVERETQTVNTNTVLLGLQAIASHGFDLALGDIKDALLQGGALDRNGGPLYAEPPDVEGALRPDRRHPRRSRRFRRCRPLRRSPTLSLSHHPRIGRRALLALARHDLGGR